MLCFRKGELAIQDFIEVDFAYKVDSMRSTTSYVFTVGTTAYKIFVLSATIEKYITLIVAGEEWIL